MDSKALLEYVWQYTSSARPTFKANSIALRCTARKLLEYCICGKRCTCKATDHTGVILGVILPPPVHIRTAQGTGADLSSPPPGLVGRKHVSMKQATDLRLALLTIALVLGDSQAPSLIGTGDHSRF